MCHVGLHAEVLGAALPKYDRMQAACSIRLCFACSRAYFSVKEAYNRILGRE